MKTVDKLLYEAKKKLGGIALYFLEDTGSGWEMRCALPGERRRVESYGTLEEARAAVQERMGELPPNWECLVIIDDCGEEVSSETADEADHAGGGTQGALPCG